MIFCARATPTEHDDLVIGFGYNITRRGTRLLEQVLGRPVTAATRVTRAEAQLVLEADRRRAEEALTAYFPGFPALTPARRQALLELTLDLGLEAIRFQAIIAAVKVQDWTAAAKEIYRSQPAEQADRLARAILTGQE